MALVDKLSVCYILPGQKLLSTAGPSRNALSLARALAQYADVTLAFRSVLDEKQPTDLPILEIQPGARSPVDFVDDAAVRGLGYGEFFTYLRDLRGFVSRELGNFDVVLEKSWLLSGYLSTLCRRRGRPGVPIENFVPNPVQNAASSLGKRLRIEVGQRIAGHHLRQAPLIIAETQYLKRGIAQYWRVPEDRIAVVGLGVDRGVFTPLDQQAARRELGIAPDRLVLVYVGVIDVTHNLGPILEAAAGAGVPGLELHVVGDGILRRKHQQAAAARGAPVVFHGLVPHERVPLYIAAADLCLAPYDSSAFRGGELGYSTMKVPEYMSMGRPVATMPSGRLRELVRDGETGLFVPNTAESWIGLLRDCPSRDRLRAMGEAAAKVDLMSWDDVARAYLALLERKLARAQWRGAA